MRAHRPFKVKAKGETKTRYIIEEWLPIQGWTESMVWAAHDRSGMRRAVAYELGFKRQSCTICPLAGHDEGYALGVLTYPEYADALAAIERRTGKTFKEGTTIAETRARAMKDSKLVETARKARDILKRRLRNGRKDPGRYPRVHPECQTCLWKQAQ